MLPGIVGSVWCLHLCHLYLRQPLLFSPAWVKKSTYMGMCNIQSWFAPLHDPWHWCSTKQYHIWLARTLILPKPYLRVVFAIFAGGSHFSVTHCDRSNKDLLVMHTVHAAHVPTTNLGHWCRRWLGWLETRGKCLGRKPSYIPETQTERYSLYCPGTVCHNILPGTVRHNTLPGTVCNNLLTKCSWCSYACLISDHCISWCHKQCTHWTGHIFCILVARHGDTSCWQTEESPACTHQHTKLFICST